MKIYDKNESHQKTIIVLILFIALILVLALTYIRNKSTKMAVTSLPTQNTVSYSPPTKEEKQQVNDHKEELAKQQEEINKVSGNQKEHVTPIITGAEQVNGEYYSDHVEVRAYIPGVIENNGVCVISLKKGSSEVTKSVDGLPDATTTRCDHVYIARSEFPSAGMWILTVSYSSESSTGKSDTWNVDVK